MTLECKVQIKNPMPLIFDYNNIIVFYEILILNTDTFVTLLKLIHLALNIYNKLNVPQNPNSKVRQNSSMPKWWAWQGVLDTHQTSGVRVSFWWVQGTDS